MIRFMHRQCIIEMTRICIFKKKLTKHILLNKGRKLLESTLAVFMYTHGVCNTKGGMCPRATCGYGQ